MLLRKEVVMGLILDFKILLIINSEEGVLSGANFYLSFPSWMFFVFLIFFSSIIFHGV